MAQEDRRAAEVRKILGRGPNHPFIGLRRALERARQVVDSGAERTSLSPAAVYLIWGYMPASSGARQTMAAMKAYGLVEYVGRGTDRQVRLTREARLILIHHSPGSPERAEALRRAALSPPAFADLWQQFAPTLPPAAEMAAWLVRHRKFNKIGAEAAAAHFSGSIEFAAANTAVASANRPQIVKEQAAGKISGDFLDHEIVGEGLNVVFDMRSLTIRGRTSDLAAVEQLIADLEELKPILARRWSTAEQPLRVASAA